MKLNVAAALFQSECVQPGDKGRVGLIVSLVLASLLFFASGSVIAADEDTAPEPHALATAIENDNANSVDQARPAIENATWENSRQIAVMSSWTEGDAYWGPAYHEDGAYRLSDTDYDR